MTGQTAILTVRIGRPKSKTRKAAKAAFIVSCVALVPLILPLLCVLAGIECICDRCKIVKGRVRASRHVADEEQTLRKEAPKSLGIRKRALTLPLPDERSAALSREPTQCTIDQSQSTFFGRVPYEIREMIYGHAFAAPLHIHIFRRTDRRLGHYICHNEHRERRPLRKTDVGNCCGTTCTSSSGAWIPGTWVDDHVSDVLPLLRTCRRMCILFFRDSRSNTADPLKGTPRELICSTAGTLFASMIMRPSVPFLEQFCHAA